MSLPRERPFYPQIRAAIANSNSLLQIEQSLKLFKLLRSSFNKEEENTSLKTVTKKLRRSLNGVDNFD